MEEDSGAKFRKDLFEDCAKRRTKLVKQMSLGSIAVLPGAGVQYRNNDAEYPFRQNSHFYYLTAFCEPEAVLVLIKNTDSSLEYILFCRGRNPEEEIWTGPRASMKEAKEVFGADRSFDISELDAMLPTLLNQKKIYYTASQNAEFDARMTTWTNQVHSQIDVKVSPAETWVDLVELVSELRVYKSPYEIAVLKEAARISAEAHERLMRFAARKNENTESIQSTTEQKFKKLWEYQLEGEFVHECFKQGARFMAYTPIVASGKNACVLHYVQNDKPIQPDELILVDAGCEYHYYAADITRTFPSNGRFTADQKSIYELVLASQAAAIAITKPGTPWHKLQEIIVAVLVKGLVDLKILKGDVDQLIQDKAYRQYYMHSSGHWLGLDVHDSGPYKINGESRPLEAGMVLTIEPGLYLGENPNLDRRWWNIGVRIEDDVLVTTNGCDILTQAAPKTVKEIEAIMAAFALESTPISEKKQVFY